MPSLAATGAKIGTSTITPGRGSMKMPKINKKMLTAIKKVKADMSCAPIHSASLMGRPSMVKIHAKALEVPMMMSTEAVINAERDKMSGTAFHSNVR